MYRAATDSFELSLVRGGRELGLVVPVTDGDFPDSMLRVQPCGVQRDRAEKRAPIHILEDRIAHFRWQFQKRRVDLVALSTNAHVSGCAEVRARRQVGDIYMAKWGALVMPSLVSVVLGLTAAGCAVPLKLAAAVPLLPGASCAA